MPADSTTIQEIQTKTAADLQKTNESAMKSVSTGGLNDPEFLKGLQDAIDKDAGKAAVIPVTPPPAAAAKPADPAPKPVVPVAKPSADEIPADLLGEVKPVAKPVASDATAPADADADAERQRQIDEQTKGMTPKAAERFKRIEARAYEADKRAKAIEAELIAERAKKPAAAPVPQVDTAEIERLRKQNEEYDAIIAKHAIQEHPGFKAKYDSAIAKEIAAMVKLVPQEHAEEFSQLASLPDSKKRNERILEIVDGIQDSIHKTKVQNGLERTDSLSNARAEQLANWKEGKVHAEAEQIRQQETEQARQMEIQKVAWVKGMTKLTSPETGLEVFRKSEGSDEWNAGVDNRVISVERLLSGMKSMPPEQIVELAARSVALDDYRRMFIAQRILNQKLSSELEEMRTAAPDTAGNQGGDSSTPDKMSYIEAITRGTQAAGALK